MKILVNTILRTKKFAMLTVLYNQSATEFGEISGMPIYKSWKPLIYSTSTNTIYRLHKNLQNAQHSKWKNDIKTAMEAIFKKK